MLVIDWSQTRYIAKHPSARYVSISDGHREKHTEAGFIETNPFLGDHPSVREVDHYFAVSALVQFGIAHVLPTRWRNTWQVVFIATHGSAAANNYQLGIRTDF